MIRVLSYPPRHPYVDRLHGRAARLVHRDEPWPRLPHFYDPAWLRAHRADWDLVHLHFTWEQYPPAHFASVLETHRRARVPVVWTAHDLRSPHTTTPENDQPYLELLGEHAVAVVTLTPHAAEEVGHRFGRPVTILPHGPLLTMTMAASLRRRRRRPDTPTVLLHAKSGRANLDLRGAVAAAHQVIAERLPLRLHLSVHEDLDLSWLDESPPWLRVDRHGRWSDRTLAHAVADAHALLLPYRWGTHSGLLELAHDVGTPVVATDVGGHRAQRARWLVPADADGVDVDGLARALADVARGAPAPPVPLRHRRLDRDRVVLGHRALYRRLARASDQRRGSEGGVRAPSRRDLGGRG